MNFDLILQGRQLEPKLEEMSARFYKQTELSEADFQEAGCISVLIPQIEAGSSILCYTVQDIIGWISCKFDILSSPRYHIHYL